MKGWERDVDMGKRKDVGKEKRGRDMGVGPGEEGYAHGIRREKEMGLWKMGEREGLWEVGRGRHKDVGKREGKRWGCGK